jgi:nicotinamide-nucleotide amidase
MVAVKEIELQKSTGPPSLCTIELLCIGNELLIGKTLNSNAQWLAQRITRLGGNVSRETTVRDNLDEIASSIRDAVKRKPDLIITSGGLGPTHDDMTLQGVARAVGRPVQLNQTAVQLMKAHYREIALMKNIRLNKPRLKMARIPVGSEPIENPVGSAPAVMTKYEQVKIISLPGVPRELKAIFNRSIAPLIQAKTRNTSFFEQRVKVRGIVESELSPIIDKVMNRYPNVFIKSHPRGGKVPRDSHLELHFSSTSSDESKTKAEISHAVAMMARFLASSKVLKRDRRRVTFRPV